MSDKPDTAKARNIIIKLRWTGWLACLSLLLLPQSIRAELPKRIISLAPSITEIIYAIGAEEKLVGVSTYCDYPAAAKALPDVGGLADVRFESIVALRPDLVIVLRGHSGAASTLRKLGLSVLSVDNESVAAILDSIHRIGEALGAVEESRRLIQALKFELRQIQAGAATRHRPRVLLVVGGHTATAGLGRVYIAGKATILDELLQLAGAENAYRGSIGYPDISAEGLLALNPDMVFDLVPEGDNQNKVKEEVQRLWATLPQLAAVRRDKVYVLTEEYAVSPGPRFIKTVRLFASLIHPEGQ